MVHGGGKLAISIGSACRSHAAASSCAMCWACRSEGGRVGYRSRIDSSVSTRAASSFRNRSPRRRGMARTWAWARIRSAAQYAAGGGIDALTLKHPNSIVPRGVQFQHVQGEGATSRRGYSVQPAVTAPLAQTLSTKTGEAA